MGVDCGVVGVERHLDDNAVNIWIVVQSINLPEQLDLTCAPALMKHFKQKLVKSDEAINRLQKPDLEILE
jgi:hypothetical protein